MSNESSRKKRLTAPAIRRMKRKGRRISVLTAYDALFARLLDRAGVDVLLVGDSLGMVVQGHPDTLSVTMEQMLYHTKAVVRASSRAHVVADMPFMSYQSSIDDGLRNAGRMLKEGGAQSVKLEGGRRHAALVERLVQIGIPVMGHLGLTPQSIHGVGGYRVQGRRESAAEGIVADAGALEQAGVYAIVLEAVPVELARQVRETVTVPTIGIGAGPHCDGQVLVVTDMLGMDPDFCPRFVKRYAELAELIEGAVQDYRDEVTRGVFPLDEHCWHTERDE
jgi:3-methyl-2-oxobutanoate hydroxymethyltransferase